MQLFRLHNEKQQGAVDRGSKVDSKVERRGMQERPWVEGEEVMSNEVQIVEQLQAHLDICSGRIFPGPDGISGGWFWMLKPGLQGSF